MHRQTCTSKRNKVEKPEIKPWIINNLTMNRNKQANNINIKTLKSEKKPSKS